MSLIQHFPVNYEKIKKIDMAGLVVIVVSFGKYSLLIFHFIVYT